jgi:3',5'-nucleoside bisphosphate phosphatase
MPARLDLHTHSHYSDGALSPDALAATAALREVALLALTDHDTMAGCAAAQAACDSRSIRFLPGVELSCDWRGREIHVVGLNVDPTHAGLQAHCQAMHERRHQRIGAIATRLSAAGLPGDELTRSALAAPSPTRSHVAQALCAAGIAKDAQAAFDYWLARGCRGYVAAQWDALADVVRRVVLAGGIAVLAHPHRYRVSHGQLRELVSEFKQAGGVGIEVSLAGMGPGDTDRAASLARRFDLAGSFGSDFHQPGLPWRPLGRFDKLPEGVTPVTVHLGTGVKVTGQS